MFVCVNYNAIDATACLPLCKHLDPISPSPGTNYDLGFLISPALLGGVHAHLFESKEIV
jgi:hypothetical protein